MADITVANLHKRFDRFVAVKNSTFTINDGEFFVLLGPSGCGKTTTLRMIAGLELPTSGQIKIEGDDVSFLRASQRDIAFVFQMFALYPHMNVRQNISFPLKCQGVARAEIKERVAEVADILRIEHLLDSPVGGLSSGDKQRVSLGRAIIRKPQAFLMDEPLGALDSEFRHLMCSELKELHNRMGATTVYVTHDQLEAMSMADKIMVMNHSVIEQVGAPQFIYDFPNTIFVAKFLGEPSMNIIEFEGSVAQGADSVCINSIKIAVARIVEGVQTKKLALGVRPEHVSLVEFSHLKGMIDAVEYLGTTQVLTINSMIGKLKARVDSHIDVERGQQVYLQLNPEHTSVFDRETDQVIMNTRYEEAYHAQA
ncbi:ABC transporter ATP-binding protein [Enterovibrio norvegicus FF-33]|uniref:ABC transporter ATP-binding protein n=1 Tax=Enterovibrio norvegicus FF-454 TaxID=1185651 RepID=A0A1E5CCW3_9GAMM|nr:ABC transporter ATP-binding protein [Enterovibrio norvegicus]OEE63356.1 ABC transporter ATP-binding protein [Enterovibrio norvegicus FF-454]OEE69994.1 ABC transporter ATP-binding protein [Enterovibrio norvegicus FF-33]OEE76185.1 ABC transporter ATP-binding protein [Enterovibrio norvegicus FF-162]